MNRNERLNKWYKDARVGLFIHWANTGDPQIHKRPLFHTAEEFEAAATNGGWSADKWVIAAKKMHAQYITLAAFHSVLGYVRVWKTNIPGAPKTKRDFLGELITACEKENIKVIVYITSDPSESHQYNDNPWIKPGEYAAYKNDDSINIANYLDFQRYFAKDIIEELIHNYPSIAGFWFDGWNDLEVCNEVFSFIHNKNPEALVIRNDFGKKPYDDEDVMAVECLGKINSPNFDYASGGWIESGNAEYCYTPLGDWMYYNSDPLPCNQNTLIKPIMSIVTNGWVAAIGFGPKTNGDFPDEINKFTDKLDKFYNWSYEAIFEAEYGGFIPGNWNNDAYGYTTANPQKDLYYIHIVTAPTNGILTLSDNGLDIKEISNLKTGEIVNFKMIENNYCIALDNWSGINIDGIIILKVSAVKYGRFVSFDISESKEHLPCTIELNLEKNCEIDALEITEFENSSVTTGGWGAPSNNRLKEFKIYKMDNDKCELVVEGNLINQRGKKWIQLGNIKAKKLKFEAVSAYDTSGSVLEKWNFTWSAIDKDILSVDSDYNGVLWFVNNSNELWKKNGIVSTKMKEGVLDVYCGNDGKVYIINLEYHLYRYERGWISMDIDAKSICVSKYGAIFYVDLNGMLNSHKVIISTAQSIAISPNDDLLFVDDNNVYKYCNEKVTQIKLPHKVKQIAITDNDGFYIIDINYRVYGVSNDGANSYIIAYNAEKLTGGRDGNLFKICCENTGNLNIKEIRIKN